MKTSPGKQRNFGPKHNQAGSKFKNKPKGNNFFRKGGKNSTNPSGGNDRSAQPPGRQAGGYGGKHQVNNNNRPSFGQNRNDSNQRAGKWNKPKPHGGRFNTHQQKPQQHQHQQQHQQQQRTTQNLDSLFTVKPAKLDYCLAPERLEAQGRALKRFEQQEQEQDRQKHRNEKDRRHKLMTAKTRKGQPVMQGRMELLYKKVQKMVDQG
ncbi:GATA zinc finger domain-containing protein 10-like [Sabethes cyaneus]|uniref:GATA zinc finger domain-containing protein 10-like n=1 Tax=Sabethes cyaneus TaxID=53552 RepID=UPI00237D8967|nr:GATA zinc finger domain-containing protein 10-like [Sabethes cyaneus]